MRTFFFIALIALALASNESDIWKALKKQINNDYGVAGLMGNLQAESGLLSNNLENRCNNNKGISDDTYTKRVDSGAISKSSFVNDACGYGLAQWTYWSRKQNLYNFVKGKGKSIGDMNTQVEFLVSELQSGFASVWNTLKNAKSVSEASNAVLLKFERPYDTSTSMQNRRAGYGQTIYNNNHGTNVVVDPVTPGNGTKKCVVGIKDYSYLNVRSCAGTSCSVVGTLKNNAVIYVYATKSGWSKIDKSANKWVINTYVGNCPVPGPVNPGFKKRTTIPEYGNKYYNTKSNGGYSTAIVGSPTRAGLNVLSNCVGYAAGRFNEIIGAGKFKYLNYPPNAGQFCSRARSEGLTTSSTPTLGAIISWTKSGAAGHVGVVEEIYSDGSILTSESGWNSSAFWTKRRYKSNNWGAGSSYQFACFIKNPAVK